MPRRGNTTRAASLNQADSDGFGPWIARYIEWMAIHNYSPFTVDRREPQLVYLAQWCAARDIFRPRDVTRPILERYQRYLYEYRKPNGRTLTWGSQVQSLGCIKQFFSWMTKQNALLWNPASDIELPRVPKRLPRSVVSAGEIEAILAQADLSSPMGIRDRAMMEVLYSTGIRRFELTGMKLSDIDSERGTLLIREGKGRRDRMVPLGARAADWVDKYLLDVRPELATDSQIDAVFIGLQGEPLEPGYVTLRIGRYVQAAKIGKTGSCHLFRHSMATLMLEGGADVRFIQHMLGHASLESTAIYTRVSIRTLKAVHEASHPAERKRTSQAGTAPMGAGVTGGKSSNEGALFLSLAAEAIDDDGARESRDTASGDD